MPLRGNSLQSGAQKEGQAPTVTGPGRLPSIAKAARTLLLCSFESEQICAAMEPRIMEDEARHEDGPTRIEAT